MDKTNSIEIHRVANGFIVRSMDLTMRSDLIKMEAHVFESMDGLIKFIQNNFDVKESGK